MTKMTRETYAAMGRECAQQGHAPVTTLRAGTWQYRAWMDGYNFVALRASYREPGKSHLPPLMNALATARFLQNVHLWPPSAREHVRNLILDMNKERNPDRLRRLALAIQRMAVRHDPRPELRVWIDEANATATHQNVQQRNESDEDD